MPPAQKAAPPPPRLTPATNNRSLRSSLIIGGIVLLVACGGGLVSCVSAVVDSVSDVTSQASDSDNLLSADGWTTMISDLDDGINVRTTVEAVVRRRAATVALPDSADSVSRYYYDGDITMTAGAARDPARAEFDLTLVDGSAVESAVTQARQRSGASDSTEAYVLVSAITKDEPTLLVTFPGVVDGYSLEVALDGSVVSENQEIS